MRNRRLWAIYKYIIWCGVVFVLLVWVRLDSDEQTSAWWSVSWWSVAYADKNACFVGNQQQIVQRYIGTITVDWNTLIDNLLLDRSYPNQRFALITQYCDSVLGLKEENNLEAVCFENNGYLYDPRQSLFVYSLCVNMDKRTDIPDHIGSYQEHFLVEYPYADQPLDVSLLVNEDLDLNTVWGLPRQDVLDSPGSTHPCDPKWFEGRANMQSCQLSTIVPRILERVLNEYTNLKMAAIYGYRYGNSREDRQRAISAFVDRHFNGDILDPNSPCNDPWVQYIQDSPSSFDGDKSHCGHPQTYKILDDTLQTVHQLVDRSVLLHPAEIYATACTKSSAGGAPQTLHSCAFSTYGHVFYDTSWEAFKNLLLNELFYYELFVDYYTNMLLYNLHYNPLRHENLAVMLNRNQREIDVMIQDKQINRYGVRQSIRLLGNMYALYPIHIWLSAYYEDLIQYRDRLATVYTPLHQLFTSLLRNAQEKN